MAVAMTHHLLRSFFIAFSMLTLGFVSIVESGKKNDDKKVADNLIERNEDSKSGKSDHEMPSSKFWNISPVSFRLLL